jgi:hypothetical protein
LRIEIPQGKRIGPAASVYDQNTRPFIENGNNRRRQPDQNGLLAAGRIKRIAAPVGFGGSAHNSSSEIGN